MIYCDRFKDLQTGRMSVQAMNRPSRDMQLHYALQLLSQDCTRFQHSGILVLLRPICETPSFCRVWSNSTLPQCRKKESVGVGFQPPHRCGNHHRDWLFLEHETICYLTVILGTKEPITQTNDYKGSFLLFLFMNSFVLCWLNMSYWQECWLGIPRI